MNFIVVMDKVFSSIRALTLCVCLLLLSMSAIAASLNELVEQKPRQALPQIKAALAKDSNDENALFLQARVHENLGKIEVAKRQYELFIQRFPTRPEAYLNLANIYSQKGNYTKARQLLEQGLSSKPEYAQTYQSLKKLNSHLAIEAYQRALSKKSQRPAPVLATAKNLSTRPVQIKEVEVIKEIEVIKEVVKEVPIEVIKEVVVIKEVPVEVIKEIEVIKEVIKEVSVPMTVASANNTNTEPQAQEVDEVQEFDVMPLVKAWASAWSDQSVGRFVSFYAPNYSASGRTRSQWLEDRKLKLTNKTFINVSANDLQQKQNGNLIQVTFTQNYQSNVISGISTKRLTFRKIGQNWKIVAEKIIRE